MPTFFEGGEVGRTVACLDTHAQGTTSLVTPEPNISWSNHKSIITRVTVAQQGNFQFLHTIGNDVYIYVFGDRIGQASISGLSMAADCAGGGGGHGFEKVAEWYGENRLAQKKAPITVTIGRTPVEGFVTGFTSDLIDPSTRIMQYTIQLVVLPEKV